MSILVEESKEVKDAKIKEHWRRAREVVHGQNLWQDLQPLIPVLISLEFGRLPGWLAVGWREPWMAM